jgi:hypothetical protein
MMESEQVLEGVYLLLSLLFVVKYKNLVLGREGYLMGQGGKKRESKKEVE